MAQNLPKIPKVREYAELELADGTKMTGYMFVDATSRIQDVLNDEKPYFAFADEDGSVVLINKAAIVRVRPFDK
jgi:hypothetical protein